ncbi:hypothetical protein PGTUg99_002780 [Puccinia graminis f. sp. tritici]|uniref:Uncharacterized protein n=1 Tax=Puccinia graminis f. sp. tritici TaxID=56615 RepID=A0A5B0MK89_PUCGR|nr:hypothetical protein PGTUg99_002780 [Puccinia graminis f. sp. tritici]
MKPSDSNVIVKIEALKYPIDLNNTDGPIQESSQIEECPLCLEECTAGLGGGVTGYFLASVLLSVILKYKN